MLTSKGQHEGILGVMGMFFLLIEVVIIRFYVFAKTQNSAPKKRE